MALCPGLPGWAGTRRNTHQPSWSSNLYQLFHLPQSIASSLFKLHAWQPLSMSSLVYLLVWSHPSRIPYISSPNQCLLFATHAHTIATCFAVVSILYHLFLVFLWTPYLELSFTLTLHIHLTILISDRWSATSFSFLTSQVLLSCSILHSSSSKNVREMFKCFDTVGLAAGRASGV